jgi:glycosyltransferase involved in cell wall biosynthesis
MNMSDSAVPEMSVVIVTPHRYETIRKTIKHLRAQTARDRLEVIIVAPSADKLGLDEAELEDFLQFRVVEVGAIKSTGGALAAGVRQARAPLVAYAEEHSYPHPAWAEALIKAHCQPWAAVGAVIANANPSTVKVGPICSRTSVLGSNPPRKGKPDACHGTMQSTNTRFFCNTVLSFKRCWKRKEFSTVICRPGAIASIWNRRQRRIT